MVMMAGVIVMPAAGGIVIAAVAAGINIAAITVVNGFLGGGVALSRVEN
jgi:hypothetical protein